MKKIYSVGFCKVSPKQLVLNKPDIYHYVSRDVHQLICSECDHSMSQHVSYHTDSGFKLICPTSIVIVDIYYNMIGIIDEESIFNKYFSTENKIDEIVDNLISQFENTNSDAAEEVILTTIRNIFETQY